MEILKLHKDANQIKLKEVIKPGIVQLVIEGILLLIVAAFFTLFGISLLKGHKVLAIILICVTVINFVAFLVAYMMLTYGVSASVLHASEGKKLTFKTLLQETQGKGQKVIEVNIQFIINAAWYLLVFILGTGILSFIDPDTSSVIALVLAIVILMILALASLKIAFLIVSSVIANFIIADYSNKTAKEIKKKAVYILSHKLGMFLRLISTYVLWGILFIVVNYFAETLSCLIWKPTIIEQSILDNRPSIVLALLYVIKIAMFLVVSLKVLTGVCKFYEAQKPHELFDDDYRLEKENKRYFATSLLFVVVALSILVGMATAIKTFCAALVLKLIGG